MASVFGVSVDIDIVCSRAVREGGARGADTSMAATATDPHRDRVAEDDGPAVSISRGAASSCCRRHARRAASHGDHGNRKREKFVVHVARVVWDGHGRDHGGGSAVDRVAARHDAAMSRVGIAV